MLLDSVHSQSVQGICLLNSNKTVHIVTNYDSTINKEIVLWEDILMVFPNAVYLQDGTKVLPFLRGPDFKMLDPLRIAAVPGIILEVVVNEQTVDDIKKKCNGLPPYTSQNSKNCSPLQASPQYNSIALNPPSTRRNPAYGEIEVAMENYTHMDLPRFNNARYPQLASNNHNDPSLNTMNSIRGPSFVVESSLLPIGDSDDDFSEESLTWLQKAASQGNIRAQYYLGARYCRGRGGVLQDYAIAMKWYLEAAEHGLADAQNCIGIMYQNGMGVSQDYKLTMKWYLKAAAQGNARAQTNIGVMYRNGIGVPQDYSVAMEWYLKAAEQGAANAQLNIGHMYRNGLGVPQDFSVAMVWYLKAAEGGLAMAQANIGSMYEFGRGVSKDYNLALEWYLKAAEQGHPRAQNNIGGFYKAGLGVQQDFTQAFYWHFAAAQQGLMNAQVSVADAYMNGLGTSRDYVKAATWYSKAAQQGQAHAQFSLAFLFDTGLGVPQDNEKAMKLYAMAADQGIELAQRKLYLLKNSD
ncbi:hypothetical protein FBU30_008153 [Linnemannia zychae]|nr:hypothetical protein FBU30_008153 [Linnemannia zychae]